MKIDYWTCELCGTDYGYDQSYCVDPQCREESARLEALEIQELILIERGQTRDELGIEEWEEML